MSWLLQFNWLLYANNITSAAMIVTCWWLAHQYGRIAQPPGRAIAIGFSLLGITTLFTLLARNLGVPVGWPIVASKAILSGCFVLIIIRRTQIERE